MTTYTPNSYLRAEAALNTITQDVTRLLSQKDNILAQLSQIEGSLQKLAQGAPVGWADLVVYVNQRATADPTDPQWKDLKGRMDKVVADFQNERREITAILAAISAVG